MPLGMLGMQRVDALMRRRADAGLGVMGSARRGGSVPFPHEIIFPYENIYILCAEAARDARPPLPACLATATKKWAGAAEGVKLGRWQPRAGAPSGDESAAQHAGS